MHLSQPLCSAAADPAWPSLGLLCGPEQLPIGTTKGRGSCCLESLQSVRLGVRRWSRKGKRRAEREGEGAAEVQACCHSPGVTAQPSLGLAGSSHTVSRKLLMREAGALVHGLCSSRTCTAQGTREEGGSSSRKPRILALGGWTPLPTPALSRQGGA